MSTPQPTPLSLQNLQSVVDTLPVAFFVKDLDSRLLLVNKTCEDVLGVPFEDLRGTRGDAYYTPEQLTRTQEKIQESLASGRTVRYETHYWNAQHGQRRWGQTSLKPVYDAQGHPLYLMGTTVDIHAQKQLQQLLDGERTLLEMMARNAPLPDILDTYARSYEATFSGMLCAILLFDADGMHLRHGAAPSLPAAYCQAMESRAAGPHLGFGGPAVPPPQDTVVSDIATDPLWQDHRDLALAHGLHACWCAPIVSSKGQVWGTFAVYHATRRTPRAEELQAIQRGAYMAGLAMGHHAAERQRQADQEALHEAVLHTRTILDNILDGVVTINQQGVIQSFNKAAATIFGYQPEEVLGSSLGILLPEGLRNRQDSLLRRHTRTGPADFVGTQREAQGQRKDGTVFPVSLSVSKITHAGQPLFIGVIRDITLRRQSEQEIRRLAFYDPLTELPNRRLLTDRLQQAMVTSARTGQHGAVMFLDLDNFKQLNDTHGHDAGDLLLQQVAIRLRTCVREGDSVARLGGDEFVVLLENLSPSVVDSATHAELVASKIQSALGQPYNLRGLACNSTPSVGIAVYLGDNEGTDDLLKKADVAMYQAKAAGRNTVRFFDPAMQASVNAHAALAHDMRRGLARHEFMLLYQFQVDVHGMPTGAEALLRWNHPTQGMVSPAQFIPLAEESGMGLALGRWVLESACNQLRVWADQPVTRHWTLAVNVSASQFAQADFVAQVASALRQSGASPQRLTLELTERIVMDHPDDTRAKMNALKALGVRLSLDDFGTGYSSLLHLQQLPLDQLKIDQSFVHDLLAHRGEASVARSVVALGHSLGLTVIAEGVETAGQRNLLADLGCDAFQGYYFGRPTPAGELTHH